MPRFFIDFKPVGSCVLSGENSMHISRSLRMCAGDRLTLCDGCGVDYDCVITAIDKENVYLDVLGEEPSRSEPQLNVTLYQCLPKGDKMELIIQKAVEIGVHKIIPVISSRVISRPDEKSMKKKLDRWQKISLEAAKQSGRGIIPKIEPMIKFSALLSQIPNFDQSFFCYEAGGKPIDKVFSHSSENAAIIIGSEGGFSEQEAAEISNAGADTITLGPRILRAETAPIAVLSVLMLLSGGMQ